jgi:iron(III) transport system substrate-binding protein
MRGKGLGLIAVAAALFVPVFAGAADREVNIYNSRHYTTDTQLWEGFTQSTGIKVNIINADHDQLIQRLIQEGENSPADLLITVDAGRLVFAAGKDLLAPVSSAALERAIPASLRDPEGKWFGLAYRARVIVYHKDRVQPSELSTYQALAEPPFKGRLLMRSGTNIYNIGLMGARRRPRPGRAASSPTSPARRRAAIPTRSRRWPPVSAT